MEALLRENVWAIAGAVAAAITLAAIFLNRSPANAPPRVSTGLPVLGNAIAFVKGPLKMIEHFYKRDGPVFTVPMMGKSLTFLIGPEAQAPFFKHKDDVLSQNEVRSTAYASALQCSILLIRLSSAMTTHACDTGTHMSAVQLQLLVYGFMKPVFGPNVVYDAEPVRRSEQMKAMANGLRVSRLQAYVPKIEAESCLHHIGNCSLHGVLGLAALPLLVRHIVTVESFYSAILQLTLAQHTHCLSTYAQHTAFKQHYHSLASLKFTAATAATVGEGVHQELGGLRHSRPHGSARRSDYTDCKQVLAWR
eukprot:7343-Heterococcus_DN1.PRE.1